MGFIKVLSKARGTQWYAVVSIQSDVSVPHPPAQGRAIDIGIGLERFAALSDGSFIERPKFFKTQQCKLKLLPNKLLYQPLKNGCVRFNLEEGLYFLIFSAAIYQDF